MPSITSNNSIDTISSNVGTVPAYEADPTMLQQPQIQSMAAPMQDVTLYGSVTVEKTNVAAPSNTSPQTLTAVSPLVLPAQQQPQALMLSEKPGAYTPQQQQPQLQQLVPQQQQVYMQQQQPQQQHSQQQTQQQQQFQQQKYQTAVRLASLQEAAAPVDCPVCGHREITAVQSHSGNTTHVWAVLTCIFIGLGCIPYLIHGLKDAEHTCGHCGVLLARWHRSGRTVILQHA